MALEGAKTDRAGLGSSIAEEWSGRLSSQNSTEDKGSSLSSSSSTSQGPVDTTAPVVLPGVVVSSTLFSSLWKVGKVEVAQLTQGYNLAHQAPSFSDSKLQPLEDEIRRLKKERGEIKDPAFIPALDAKISRLEKAHQVLKGLEVFPVFLAGVVHQILETQGEESETVDQTLKTLQSYKDSRRKVNDLILQVAQEYPPRSPLMFELDLSDRNPNAKSYAPGGTTNREQMSAVDQPPLKTLQEFPIIQAYQAVLNRSEVDAAHLRSIFAQLRDQVDTSAFAIDSLQAVQKETERLEKLVDPAIPQFLARVTEKRNERLKEDSSYQDRLAFQETLGALPIYAMISAGLASASDFEAKPKMLLSSREDWKKELEAQRKHLEFQAERFVGDNLIVDLKGWEKSSLKPIIDRLQARMAEIDQQLQNLNPSQTYTPEGLYAVLVQETKARVEFQERYLQTLLEIKQYQVAQIPSSVEGDPLAQIGADLKQWSPLDSSLQDRLQQYAKYSEELDHIALGRSIDAKLKMLEAGTEVVAITDRAINGMMNAPHEYIAGEKLGDLANESSHLQAARFHYRGVQRLYNEGKFEEASKIFSALEQSILTVDAQEKVEWSSTFNRYAVGVGIVAGAAAVAYTGGRVAAPVVGEGASLFVNSYLFWTTYNYLEGRSRGVQINPYYDAQKSIGQNSFDTTKNTLLTYGMFRFIGWFGKSYLEGAAKEIAIQAEKELAREAVLVEGKVFVQGSAEQLLIAQRVAVIQERLLTRLQLGVGAFKAEVKGLTAWDMVQQNIELALEKKFDPARVVWNNLFTPENWEHRVLFLAALKAEGKVSHALGYRQLAEAFADKAYQVRFERLENRIHTTQQQILALQLKSAEAGNRIPEDPVKMLALIRSYEKDLSTQLRLAKEMSPELLNPESLQLLAIRAQQLGEVKILQAQYQAEADFNKAYGIKPISTELAQYTTAQGPALVKYWLDRGAKIEVADNGFMTVRLQQGEQRYYPSDYSPETIAEMRKALAPPAPGQNSSPFSNLIDGITAFFQGSPTAQKLGLTGQLLVFGGWDDPNSALSHAATLGLAVAGVLILFGVKRLLSLRGKNENSLDTQKKDLNSLQGEEFEKEVRRLVLESKTNPTNLKQDLINLVQKKPERLIEVLEILFSLSGSLPIELSKAVWNTVSESQKESLKKQWIDYLKHHDSPVEARQSEAYLNAFYPSELDRLRTTYVNSSEDALSELSTTLLERLVMKIIRSNQTKAEWIGQLLLNRARKGEKVNIQPLSILWRQFDKDTSLRYIALKILSVQAKEFKNGNILFNDSSSTLVDDLLPGWLSSVETSQNFQALVTLFKENPDSEFLKQLTLYAIEDIKKNEGEETTPRWVLKILKAERFDLIQGKLQFITSDTVVSTAQEDPSVQSQNLGQPENGNLQCDGGKNPVEEQPYGAVDDVIKRNESNPSSPQRNQSVQPAKPVISQSSPEHTKSALPTGEEATKGVVQGLLDFADAMRKNTPVGSGFPIVEGLWRTLFGSRDTTEEKPLYVTRTANVDSSYLNAAKKFLKRYVKRYPKLKNLITSLGEENCLNAIFKLTSPESTNQDPIHAFFFLLGQLTESQRIDFLLLIENHGSDTLILLNKFYPERYQDGSPYWRYNNYFDERWLDLIKQGGAEVAYKAATLYKISPDYFDALSITKEKNLIILELENKEKYEALKSAASAFEGSQGKILKEMLNPVLNSTKSFLKDPEFQVMITALLYYPDHLIYALDTLPWRGNTYWAILSSLFFIRHWEPIQVLELIKDKDRLKNILPELEKEYSKWSQDHNNTKSQGAASTPKASQRSEHDLIMDRLIQEAVQFYQFSPKNTGEITRAEVRKRFNDWYSSQEGRNATSDEMTQRKLYRSVLLKTFCDEGLPDADERQIADYLRAKKFEMARGR